MGDDCYDLNDREDASQRPSHYNMMRPQFRQPARQPTQRDRYRATQYDDPMYDVVEDEEPYDRNAPFDSFGKLSRSNFEE